MEVKRNSGKLFFLHYSLQCYVKVLIQNENLPRIFYVLLEKCLISLTRADFYREF